LLLLVVGILGWRWVTYHGPRLKADRDRQARADAMRDAFEAATEPANPSFEKAAAKRIVEARAAQGAIASLRKQKKEITRRIGRGLPIPSPLSTTEMVTARFLQFRLRELDFYRTRTKDQGAAREAGEAFLNPYLEQHGRRDVTGIDYPALRKLGDAAIAAGSRDPMVRTYHAIVLRESGEPPEVPRNTWTEVLRELEGTGFPRMVPLYAAASLWGDSSEEARTREAAALAFHFAIVEWLKEESRDPQWLESVCERLWTFWHQLPSEERQRLAARCLLEEEIDPYIAHALAGTHFVDRAWQQRGGGWSANVKPDRWEGFEQNLKAASEHLQYAWSLHPELPYAPERMIPIAMAEGPADEDAYFWFVRTTEARFDEWAAYDSFSRSLTSRWGGQRQWLYDFAGDCIDTQRFDTFVPYAAINAILMVEQYELGEKERLADDPHAVRLADQFVLARERFRKGHPETPLFDASGASRSEVVRMLAACNLEVECGVFLNETQGKLDWTRLVHQNRPGRYLAARSRAATKETVASLLAFDARLREPIDPAAAPDSLVPLEQESRTLREQAGAAGADYFRHADEILRQRRAFLAGDWVELPLDRSLAGAEPYADDWSVDPPKDRPAADAAENSLRLSGRRGQTSQLALRPLAGFRPPLQIELEIDVQEPAPYPPRIGIGWSRERLTTYQDRGGQLPLLALDVQESKRWDAPAPERSDMACISFWGGNQSSNLFLADGPPHRLAARLWDDHCEFRIDEGWLASPLKERLDPEGWLCLGSCWPDVHRPVAGAFALRGIRLRRLASGTPPAETEPLDERSRYWEERVATDPGDIVALAKLTRVRFEQGRDDDVVELASRAHAIAPQVNGVRVWKGTVLARRGEYAAAIAEWEPAHNEPGDDYELCWRMGEVLACVPDDAIRNTQRALQLARFGCGGDGSKNPQAHAALAAAYAGQGQFEEAIKAQEEFLKSAKTTDHDGTERLALYRDEKPFRFPARPPAPPKNPSESAE